MTQLETKVEQSVAGPRAQRGWKLLAGHFIRTLIAGLIGIVSLFVLWEARALWREYDFLRQEIADADRSAVMGYPGISARLTYAQRPQPWYRQEGKSILIWAKWVDGVGHRWYRTAAGDVDPGGLFVPHQQSIAMAIDYPKVETEGGTIWRRLPGEVMVIGQVLAGRQCVYPVPVLLKVEVINDVVEDQPFLVTGNILAPPDRAFSIFDASVGGRRVTMSASGYFHDRRPILYDRGTESLWMEQADNLTAIAGKLKGTQLERVAKPVPVAWHTWRLSNPRSRLLIGADRTQAVPHE
ncbi:MAG: DUF3179 domain-containing (seleno)protein [Isosphaeraceae bacterium]